MPGPGNDLIDELEVEAVARVLRSGYLGRYGPDDDSFGAEVLTLEQSVAELVGVRHSVAVNSGTSAIWILLSALGIGPGDEVIVPGFTFVASMSSIVYAGAKPVLAEVDDTFNLDPVDVESRITPQDQGDPRRAHARRTLRSRRVVEHCRSSRTAADRGCRPGLRR